MRAAPALLLAVAVLSCTAPPAAATPAPSVVAAGGTLRVAIPAEVTALEPWEADAASSIATRQVFETLVVVDPLQAHMDQLLKWTDADMHNVTAYLASLK